MTTSSLQSRILEELSYTDLTEVALGKLLKSPVHQELRRLEKECKIKRVTRRDEEVWEAVG